MPPKKANAKKAAVQQKPAKSAKTAEAKEAEKRQQQRAAIRDHFRRFDLNGDGIISHEEMTMVLQSLDPETWSDEAIRSMLENVDKNNDGAIQYEEFCDWVFEEPANYVIIDAVKAVSHEGHKYLVLEVLDNNIAFLRTPKGAIIAALPYSRESGGCNSDLVHAAGRSFTAESAFKSSRLPADVPLLVVLDAARAGGNYLANAALHLLSNSQCALGDPKSELVKFVIAAPTLETPRACLLGSSALSTRYFLWEFQRACAKFKFEGKVAFVPREALYVGQETLFDSILPVAFDGLAESPDEVRNLGSKPVMDFLVKTCGQLVLNSKALKARGCSPDFRYKSSFGQYIGFEPSEDWANSWPPGYGAPTTSTLAGHTLNTLCDPEPTALFVLGDTPSEGRRIIDSRAAEASAEKVFLVTRLGLSSPKTGPAISLLKSMCEDPGVTLWNAAALEEKFGAMPPKSSGKYDDYVNACREAMDGICVLDFSVNYWVNDFLIDLIAAEGITIVQVISAGYDAERYGIDDQSGFDSLDFLDLRERLPFASISGLVTLPPQGASNLDWAHCGAFLWHLRETTDGLVVIPGEQAVAGGWGGKFLATWMSVTSTTLKQRFSGHLSLGQPHDIFFAYYREGESSSAAIDHAHDLVDEAPLHATYTVSCGMQAGYRLEALLDKLSHVGKRAVFGVCGNDPVFLQAAGETSDDHGDRSLDQGAVRYATVASGSKSLIGLLQKCADCLEEKAVLDKGRDEDADSWRVMSRGDSGLRTHILTQSLMVREAWPLQ